MVNRLGDASSPYLRQHRDNPVDWYGWGDDAFAEARARDVPVFLSIGYSACHWCHVMAHESFEDDEVAAFLNQHYVSIKVDREERPDVDAVYMDAVTALTGRGGWPLSAFLTPEAVPFFGGTYWPRTDQHGMAGFLRILGAVHDAWTQRRDEVTRSATELAGEIARRAVTTPSRTVDVGVTDMAANAVVHHAWDRRHGGFGDAPKFPQAMTIDYLIERSARTRDDAALDAATHSLMAMSRGGIHDHAAGGFHRYSTDERWLVPHFEKMLYDNALLAPAYARAWSVTGAPRLAAVARSTLDYLLRELRDPSGGFHSATDADSEGEEGRFFVWSADEFAEVVTGAGADAARFAAFFGVTARGNWEGTNILHEPVDRREFCDQHGLDLAGFEAELDRVALALREHRATRVPPGLDDKVLTSWNALAIRAFAICGAILDEPAYVDAARVTAEFLHDALVVDGRLHHVWHEGRVTVPAFLEDVAYLAVACLDLYAASGDRRWFVAATRWAEDAVARFHDDAGGAYFSTAHDAEPLYVRPKDTWDNATPAGSSVVCEAALRLAGYTGDAVWRDRADEVVRVFQRDAARTPTGFGWLLRVIEQVAAEPREVAVVGPPGPARAALVRELWRRPLPGAVVAVATEDDARSGDVPLLTARVTVDGAPAAYVCRGFVCDRPVTSAGDLRALLERP